MQSTFELDQAITIVAGSSRYDLHNDFAFLGYEYRPSERTARFSWVRRDASWVPSDLPARLALVFQGVVNMATKKRNDEMPLSEDDCLASISFLPKELATEFEIICPGHRSDDEHMALCLQSGVSVKIWAESVRHEVGGGHLAAPHGST